MFEIACARYVSLLNHVHSYNMLFGTQCSGPQKPATDYVHSNGRKVSVLLHRGTETTAQKYALRLEQEYRHWRGAGLLCVLEKGQGVIFAFGNMRIVLGPTHVSATIAMLGAEADCTLCLAWSGF